MDNKKLKSLFEKFEEGDIDAYFDIYQEMKIPVYTIIYRILYDHMMSEDVLQDIFLRLYRIPPPHFVENPRAWIFQMARNLAIDYKRKIKENEPLSQEREASNFTLENEITIKLDVEMALRSLSMEEREIVTLYLNGGLRFREIAKLTNTPLGTVLWRYRKSISKLRKILSGGV